MPRELSAAERALGRELQIYKARGAKLLVRGFVLLALGAVFAFFFTPDGNKPHGDLWLYRTFGERGLIWAGRGFGALVMLAGVVAISFAVRRLRTGVDALEDRSRATLGLAPGRSAPPPSQVRFLLGLLTAVLIVIALYYGMGWLRAQ